MKSFLDKLTDEIVNKYSGDTGNLCVVFPSRRAGIFFRKYLSQKINKPIWSPAVYSIEDFIRKLTPFIIPDNLILIFELFETYNKVGEVQSFDEFYPWGEMLLRDYDAVDKNLVPGDEIFRVIKEHREIEEHFQFAAEDLEDFRRFWQTFSNRELSEVQSEFIKTWEIIGKVYNEFRKSLLEKNYAYEGMAYRKIYEDVKTRNLEVPWSKVIFAGFNALTKSEEEIIKALMKQGKAETYWDADLYYVNDTTQEAGRFLRENFRKLELKSPGWIENILSGSGIDEKKSVKVIGAPLKAGQAKAFGEVLNSLLVSASVPLESVAVVLADENLLMPVLYSLPESAASVNVTMGFPMKNTPLYSLIESLRDLQKNCKTSSNSTVFYHKDAIGILMNPYVKFVDPAFIYEVVNDIKRNNLLYISSSRLLTHNHQSPELLKLIFNPITTLKYTFDYLFNIIDNISTKMEVSGGERTKFEMEYFYSLYEQLNHLKNIIEKYSGELTVETFWRLLTGILRSVRIPLTGEPLKGVQVMGLLETRTLDFENVFIISMNEGIIPKGIVHNSFIPYSIRKSFKLPTYEDEDAIPAYYFYRLLQRAKNIYLFYNTEVDKLSSGEKSRLLVQLENELVKTNKNTSYEHLILETVIGESVRKQISIDKDPEITNKLRASKFTPSDLSNYINCTLQFYFKKIAGLEEEETVEEFFSPAVFGNIVHKLIQLLYDNYKGKTVTAEIIEDVKRRLDADYDELLNQAFSSIEGLKELDPGLQGKNLLFKGIIKKLLHKILDSDKQDSPFIIIDLEKRVSSAVEISTNGELITIQLGGRIDRVDEKNKVTRIIDYKTGSFDLKTIGRKSLAEYFELVFSEPKFRENFQGYFYASLYRKENQNQPLRIAIYSLRKSNEGLQFLNEEEISKVELETFDEKLGSLLLEIFDTGKSFSQTNDKDRCSFCPYKSICYRE